MEFTQPPNQDNVHQWNTRPGRYPVYLPEAGSFAEDPVARQRNNGGSGHFLPLKSYGVAPSEQPDDGGEPSPPTAA